PQWMVGILVSWSLFELFASKNVLGQRILNFIQLVCSPFVGAIMGIAIAQATDAPEWLGGVIGGTGGLLALVLQLVQVGWFYRLQGLPIWAIFFQDILCISLVVFAFDAPQ
ncbi:DUF4126 domain-containing protein, partial [Lyngbya aestuarii]